MQITTLAWRKAAKVARLQPAANKAGLASWKGVCARLAVPIDITMPELAAKVRKTGWF